MSKQLGKRHFVLATEQGCIANIFTDGPIIGPPLVTRVN